jgi:RimJ/RimL family protein N-acetyltransferase
VTLRELRASDAASLCALLTTEEATRFISAPPATVEGFERFIGWALHQRMAGTSICYAITVPGFDTAIGIIQVRQLDPDFSAFTFQTLRVNRLEARAAVLNGRGNGALMKIGAVQEGILRQSFFKSGKFLDQALYSILPTDARLAGGIGVSGHPRVH